MERQKPGNDFDKVTKHRLTTSRIKKELPIESECLALESLYRQHFGHAVNLVFSLRPKADERVLASRVMVL